MIGLWLGCPRPITLILSQIDVWASERVPEGSQTRSFHSTLFLGSDVLFERRINLKQEDLMVPQDCQDYQYDLILSYGHFIWPNREHAWCQRQCLLYEARTLMYFWWDQPALKENSSLRTPFPRFKCRVVLPFCKLISDFIEVSFLPIRLSLETPLFMLSKVCREVYLILHRSSYYLIYLTLAGRARASQKRQSVWQTTKATGDARKIWEEIAE